MARGKKTTRHKALQEQLRQNPFMTDEQLADAFEVSVQTIRLDRLLLGIPELRERTRLMAETARQKVKAIASSDLVGELIDLELGKSGISVLSISPDMVLEKTGIARGHYMYAQANSLALAVIDAPAALTGVANVKYKRPIKINERLVAKAEVIRQRGNNSIVWVRTRNDREEVFRAKFLIVSLEDKKEGTHK